MKKIIAILLVLMCVLGLISGCNKKGNKGERWNNKEEWSKDFSSIINSLEKGNYAKAEKIIQNKIVGNIEREKSVNGWMMDYTDGLYEDYKNEIIPADTAINICAAGEETYYKNYFVSIKSMIFNIEEHRETYDSAMNSYKEGNLTYAANKFLSVYGLLNQRQHQEMATAMLDIVEKYTLSDSLKERALAISIVEKLSRYYVNSLEDDSTLFFFDGETKETFEEAVVSFYTTFAEDMLAKGHRRYAFQLYGKLRDLYLKSNVEAFDITTEKTLFNFMREENRVVQDYEGVCDIDDMYSGRGVLGWKVTGGLTATDAIVIADAAWIARYNIYPYFKLSSSVETYTEFLEFAEEFEKAFVVSDSIPTKVLKLRGTKYTWGCDSAVLFLYADGTMKYIGEDEEIKSVCNNMRDVIDVVVLEAHQETGYDTRLLVLKEDGTLRTIGEDAEYISDPIKEWENIAQITVGKEYIGSYWDDSCILGLDLSGDFVRQVEYEAYSGSTPAEEIVTFDEKIREIAGDLALTESNRIFSFFDDSISAKYGNKTYFALFPVKTLMGYTDCGEADLYYFAYTNEELTEYEIIDSFDMRNPE